MDKRTCQCIQKKFFKSNEYILFPFQRITLPIYSSYRLKITLLDNILHKSISSKESIDEVITFINRYNRIHHAISRLQKNWRLKHYKKYDYDMDIDGTPLSEYKDFELYKIIQNNTIYTFTIHDMIKIIRNALLKNDYLSPKPLFPKNPFTNLEFSHADIYGMYLHCKHYKIPLDYFIEEFVRRRLELRTFLCENNFKLTQYAINNYIYYTADEYIYEELYNMFVYLEMEDDLYDRCQVDIGNQFISYIVLVEPENASNTYMKWIIDICKGMLYPYFMHLYKTKLYDEAVDTHYLLLLGNKITDACYKYRNFWLKERSDGSNKKKVSLFGDYNTRDGSGNIIENDINPINTFTDIQDIIDNPPDFTQTNPNKWKVTLECKEHTNSCHSVIPPKENNLSTDNIIIEANQYTNIIENRNDNASIHNDIDEDTTTIASFSDLDSDIDI